MFPWSAIDPSVVVSPPSYPFPMPVPVPIPTDASRDLATVDHVEDIYKFCKLIENVSQLHDYRDS
ncbi:hypothetical protein VitviT2T_014656 [Vitis vinifera]|nr:hypothetical protein VitviT2T_014656 [Vitis vinifera]